jgi:toxin ParE1/3/4
MARYHLTRPAIGDIATVLAWSVDHFGDEARDRYAVVIATAIRHIAADPEHAASRARPEVGEHVRSWHLGRVADAIAAPPGQLSERRTRWAPPPRRLLPSW